MPDLARRFRTAVALRGHYEDNELSVIEDISDKAKSVPPSMIFNAQTWEIDKFWSRLERIKLGLIKEQNRLTEAEFYAELQNINERLSRLVKPGN